MSNTRTGSYPIGFRRAWTDWQRDLPKLIRWAKENEFPHLDFGPISAIEAREVLDAGVAIGSVDLKAWPEMVCADADRRKAAIEANVKYVEEMSDLGVSLFLGVATPADPDRPRVENFEFAARSYAELCRSVALWAAKIILEGAPGKPPYFASLACTPADLRAFFKAVDSSSLGVNFDPSHLVRMGIDPIRFVQEFAPHIHHVHAKDVAIVPDDFYDHGSLQPATFAPPHRFGGHHWRYALPGKGVIGWARVFQALNEAGYRGRVSIELEDADYNGDETAEQRGLIESRDFLASI